MAEKSVKRDRTTKAEAVQTSGSAPARLKKMTKKVQLLLAIVVLAAAGISGFFYMRYRDAQRKVTQLSNPQEAAKVETQALVAKVSKLTELPQNETPTVATVQEVAKLKGQAFFAEARDGDKALIYPQAKKAFLYRPSTNKIINIAPLNIGNESTAPAQ